VHSQPADLLDWVVLTTGTRPAQVAAAVASLQANGCCATVVVVSNGAGGEVLGRDTGAVVVESATNLGIPGGRDLGLRHTSSALVGFLDDDAELRTSAQTVLDAFAADPALGAVSLRLVDEHGTSNSRHVPRPGGRGAALPGPVTTFLGGASVIRRGAYLQVGGYFDALHYGHEELELGWRLIDAGWGIRYLPDVVVFHPRTDIGRHDTGWFMTGRNRVWVARRTLPWPIAVVHVLSWLLVGLVRAPDWACRRSYLSGWWSGWRSRWPDGGRRPITWRGVWRLTRLGRPPVI
jgi:GT2 family glycosyltransferase